MKRLLPLALIACAALVWLSGQDRPLRGDGIDVNRCSDSSRVQSFPISTATSGNVQIVALGASSVIYVCGWNIMGGGTVGFQWISGTGTACATGETDRTGVYPLVVNGGLSSPNGGGTQIKAAIGEALCVELSAAVQVDGMVTVVQE